MMMPYFERIRRNHGLEHATLNILARSRPGGQLAGHSDGNGFWIVGEIETEALADGVSEALARLQSGQTELAVHKNCGTNLLVSGFAAGLAGAAGLIGVGDRPRDKFERLPLITSLGVIALLISRPLGPMLQRKLTVSGNPGNLQITSISRHDLNGLPAHRVRTRF
jgi:hypothetical protein